MTAGAGPALHRPVERLTGRLMDLLRLGSWVTAPGPAVRELGAELRRVGGAGAPARALELIEHRAGAEAAAEVRRAWLAERLIDGPA